MEKLKEIFKVIREDFHAVVPPLVAKIDQEHHYEVWAVANGKETFFGKVVMHKDYIELAFYPDLSRETKWELYPGFMFDLLEETSDCVFKDLSPEMRKGIAESIGNLVNEFKLRGLL